MELKPGYKQTEVGVIPEDWGISSLGSMTTLLTNGFVGTVTNIYVDSDDGVIYIQGYNVEANGFNLHGIKRVSHSFHAKHQKSCLREGDLLTIQTGDIGVTTIVPREFVGANCHALIISRFDKQKACSQFYCQLFNSEKGQISFKAIETGSTMKHLNVGDMKDLLLPVPTLLEQQAIAEALSDADALIESLEQLITKKHQVKQGTMQELLTGKTRLEGFSKEWLEKRLGEYGHTFGGLTGKTKADFGDGNARYITFMNIMTNVVIDCSAFQNVKVAPNEAQNRVLKGDIFFNGSSETPEEVGLCSVLTEEVSNVFLNSFCFGFRITNGADVEGLYLAYYFRSNEGRERLKSLAQGATRYNLSKTALLKIVFPIPSLLEQQAIATVLSDMDAEITTLETKLEKARQVKNGMMHELLTGKTRLI